MKTTMARWSPEAVGVVEFKPQTPSPQTSDAVVVHASSRGSLLSLKMWKYLVAAILLIILIVHRHGQTPTGSSVLAAHVLVVLAALWSLSLWLAFW